MMDSEQHMDEKETLEAQYKRVKELTNKSHVMQFGQVSVFGPELVSDFQGPASKMLRKASKPPEDRALPHASAVDARNVKLDQLYREYARTGSTEAADRLIEEVQAKQAVNQLGDTIVAAAVGDVLLGKFPPSGFSWTAKMLDCHASVVAAFGATCRWTEGRLVLSKVLYQLCDKTSGAAAPILAALRESCRPPQEEVWA